MRVAPTDDTWVLQCRPGFEAECLEDAESRTGGRGVANGEGIVVLGSTASLPPLLDLIFARQAFRQMAVLSELPAGDRIDAIIAALPASATPVQDILLEHPDTDAGKELSGFLRKFALPLKSALAKRGLTTDIGAPERLHLLFTDSRHVRIGFSDGRCGSPHLNGIPRLKMPRDAPSRSTLKLDEALLVFLTPQERDRWLRPGLRVVDLGAAPGGWSWQMTRRGLKVTAVDNGSLQAELMATGLVEHRREDGFRYRPPRPVDWLLCDMVEQPQRIAELMAGWLVRGDCRRAVFNLKLPMKKRLDCVREGLGLIQALLHSAGQDHMLRCKQLYHDREEVTAYVALQ